MAKSYHVIITDCDHGSIEEEKEEMSRIGANHFWAQIKEEKELINICKEADGIITQYVPFTRDVIKNLPKCKIISRYGWG